MRCCWVLSGPRARISCSLEALAVAAHIAHHARLAGMGLLGGDQLLQVLDAQRHGLLHEHVLAGLHGGQGIVRVILVGRADEHRVHVGVLHQLIGVRIGLGLIGIRDMLQLAGGDVGHRRDLIHVPQTAQDRQVHHLGHRAHADHTNFHHKKTPFCIPRDPHSMIA